MLELPWTQILLSFMIPKILFFLQRELNFLWKKFVFLSPSWMVLFWIYSFQWLSCLRRSCSNRILFSCNWMAFEPEGSVSGSDSSLERVFSGFPNFSLCQDLSSIRTLYMIDNKFSSWGNQQRPTICRNSPSTVQKFKNLNMDIFLFLRG